MISVEPTSKHHHLPTQKNDTGKTHNHLEHCPSCFLQMLIPSLVPDPGQVYQIMFTLYLWFGESQAKDEFLKAIAARGPPEAYG